MVREVWRAGDWAYRRFREWQREQEQHLARQQRQEHHRQLARRDQEERERERERERPREEPRNQHRGQERHSIENNVENRMARGHHYKKGKKWHGFEYAYWKKRFPHYGTGISHGQMHLTAQMIRKALDREIPWLKYKWTSSDTISWGPGQQGFAGISLFVNALQAQTSDSTAPVLARFCQTPVTAYDTQPTLIQALGDIDTFIKSVNNGSWPTNNNGELSYEFEKVALKGTLYNHCNAAVVIKIYELRFRQNRSGLATGLTTLATADPGDIGNAQGEYYNALAQDFGAPAMVPASNLATDPNVTPFDSPSFVAKTKILKTHIFKLGAGENKTIFLKAKHLKPGSRLKHADLIQNCSNPHSRHLLIVCHGIASHDSAAGHGVTMSSGFVDVVWETVFKGRKIISAVGGNLPVTHTQNNLHTITGTEEIAPGNAQATGPITTT